MKALATLRPKFSGGVTYSRKNRKNGKASEALFKANLALSLMNPEFKFVDVELNQSLATNGTITLLNGLQKGTGISNRIGRSIKIKSIDLKFRIFKNTANAISSETLRCMLVLDTEPKATQLNLSELLHNVNIVAQALSPRNLDNRKRLVILKNWVIPMGLVGSSAPTNVFRKHYKETNYHTIYDASDAGNITDITSGALYFVSMTNQPVNPATIVMYNRLRYLDN